MRGGGRREAGGRGLRFPVCARESGGKSTARAAAGGNAARLADLFKVFGDGTRVRILFVLLTAEVCVCDLAKLLGMTQSAVSHQLRVLKQARLIKARRDGKTVFYSLADDHVATLLRQGMEHVCEGSGGECGE